MKKFFYLSLLIVAVLFIGATTHTKTSEKAYSIIPEETVVTWTAYKTSIKIPVSGVFEEVIIDNDHSGATVYEAFNGLKFSLPISGINSLSNLRDGKIKKSFFGKMISTTKISGDIKLNTTNSGVVNLTMNGVSKDLPVSYKIVDQSIVIDAVMDVNNWMAQAALEALNDECEDLHTGPDGETVTWSEVKINVTSKVKFE